VLSRVAWSPRTGPRILLCLPVDAFVPELGGQVERRLSKETTRTMRTAMRASIPVTFAVLVITASVPALAQGLPSSNLNSINNSLAAMGQANAFQQQQTSNFNTLRMEGQRNVQFQPQDAYAGPIIGRRGFRSSAGRAHIRAGSGRTLNTGICTGC
jgi:hypothetical protein